MEIESSHLQASIKQSGSEGKDNGNTQFLTVVKVQYYKLLTAVPPFLTQSLLTRPKYP